MRMKGRTASVCSHHGLLSGQRRTVPSSLKASPLPLSLSRQLAAAARTCSPGQVIRRPGSPAALLPLLLLLLLLLTRLLLCHAPHSNKLLWSNSTLSVPVPGPAPGQFQFQPPTSSLCLDLSESLYFESFSLTCGGSGRMKRGWQWEFWSASSSRLSQSKAEVTQAAEGWAREAAEPVFGSDLLSRGGCLALE